MYHNRAQEGQHNAPLSYSLAIAGLVLALLLGGPIAERWRDSNAHQRAVEQSNFQDRPTKPPLPSRPALGSNALQDLFLLVGIGGGWALFDAYKKRREPIVRVNGLPSRGSLSPATTIAS